jgi:hypothetical protein
MKIISFLILFISSLCGQNELDVLIEQVLNGSSDSASIYLPTMEQRYPNNPSLLYLKGLLESNGKEAMQVFVTLYNNHPTSVYGDDAVMKVAEYFYAAGLYVQSTEWLKKMPIYYSRSEHIERAVKLFLNSLIVSGLKDTAIFYSRVFERQFPELNVDGKIKSLLLEFKESDRAKGNSNDIVQNFTDFNKVKSNQPIQDKIISNQDDISAPFSLQSGAFSSEVNATSQRTELVISGFRARVKELYKSDKTLYAVRIGYFNNREDALKVGEQIKTKLDLDTIIIKNK